MPRILNLSTVWNRWRKANLLSISDFARALGMSRRAVNYILSGEVEPQYGTMRKFEALKERYKLNRRKS